MKQPGRSPEREETKGANHARGASSVVAADDERSG
jgi:hypothetical protein